MVFAWPAGGTFSPVVFKECQVLLQHIHSCLCGWCRSTNAHDFASYLKTKWRRRHNNAKNTSPLSTNPWEEQHSSFNSWKQSQQQISSQCSNKNRTLDFSSSGSSNMFLWLWCRCSTEICFKYVWIWSQQADAEWLWLDFPGCGWRRYTFFRSEPTFSFQLFKYSITLNSKGNLVHPF